MSTLTPGRDRGGPAPEWPPPVGSLGPVARGRRRWWPRAVVALLAVAGLLVGTVAWWAAHLPDVGDAATAYTEDFRDGHGLFEDFSVPGGSGQAREGAYWLTASEAGVWFSTVSTTASGAVFDVSASVVLTAGSNPVDESGLVVARADNEGYAFGVERGGGLGLFRWTSGDVVPLRAVDAAPRTAPAVLRLTVAWGLRGTEVVGYLDGTQVLRFVDSGGLDGFDQAGVYVFAATGAEPVTVRADDVVLRTAG